MRKNASPKQVARAIGVSESTLKRWCDSGLIPMTKTVGGHRRIEISAVIDFLRETGRSVVEPELLNLPVTSGKTEWTLSRATDRIVTSLVAGDESVVRQIVFDLLLSDHSVTAIFDDVLTPAMHRIGDEWSCGDVAVYQERRACEICMRCLHELRATSTSADNFPLAIGATAQADIYTLPITMSEIVLRWVGWKTNLLGTNLPFDTLIEAVEAARPRLLWLSVSFIADEPAFVAGVNRLFEAAHASNAAMAIGGQALLGIIRRQIQYTVFCETFRDLERFARSLNPVSGVPTPPPAESTRS